MDSGDNSMNTVKNDKQDNKIYISKDGATKEPSKKRKRPASSMVMVDRGEIFSKGKMATK